MLFDKQLAQRFTNFRVNRPGRTLPARLLHLLVAQNLAIKSERFLLRGGMQVGRIRAKQMPPQVGFPFRQRTLDRQLIQRGEKLRLPHNQAGHFFQAGLGQKES